MIRKPFFLLFVAVYFSPFFSSGQTIDSMMKVYAARFPQEKIYLQLDKKAYNPGERIWYKAYIFTGFDPSPFSKNFYAELYDAGGNLILRNTGPIAESCAIGSFDIPASYEGTRVRIRAYTAWMLNFDSSFVYTKDLRIIGGSRDSSANAIPSATVLHFFPEGGELVAGVENNVAFKAEDAYGKPRKISGTLVDQTGKILLSFKTNAYGLGKFLLAPEKQDQFYASWKDEKGIEYKTQLPSVKASGVVLRVLTAKQKLVFSVARPAESKDFDQVVIVAHMNQQMVYRAIVNLKDIFMSGGSIPTDQLPSGIVTVTLFDMNQSPLAERVSFVNNHDYSFEPKINITAKSLKKRGRNEVEVDLPDTIKSNMSLAITDAEVDGNKPWDDNIISSLLLTNDLRGYVHDPWYYFQNGTDSLMQQLDLVMLTHGWRRFKWEDLAKGKVPQIKYPLDNYLSLNAEVLGIDASRIPKDETLTVIFQDKDSASNMLSLPMVKAGKFHQEGLIFYDTAKAYYQFNISRNLSNESAVIFRNGLLPSIRKVKPFSMTMPAWSPDDTALVRKSLQMYVDIARLRDKDKKVQNLAAVTVVKRVKSDKEKLDELYASGLFSGGNATIFDLLDDNSKYGAIDIFTYLQGRVAGLSIITVGPTPTLTWRGGTPTLYLNEMQVDANSLKSMNVSDLAMVKVFSPGSMSVAGGGSGGVIAVYTKKGRDKKPDPSIKGLEMTRVAGYNMVREFYSPDYLINPEPENDDVRTTLYWNPIIVGGKGIHKMSIPFYNSDLTHQIRIVMEGFNEEGKLTHIEKIIQ